jgi:putative ABC transport system permease protein
MGILTRATRNIVRRKTRSLLVIVALSFALAMIVSIPASIAASRATTQHTIDDLTANAKAVNDTINQAATEIDCQLLAVSISDAGPSHDQTILEQPLMNITDYYANITSTPRVTGVIPILDQAENNGNFNYNVYGIPLDNATLIDNYPSILPSNITDGRNLQAGDNGVVVLEERVADNFSVYVGGTVNILGETFRVVGIEGYTPLNEAAVYMSLPEAQAITDNVGNATSFKVFADSVSNVQDVSQKIGAIFPKLSVSIAATLLDSVMQMQTQTAEQLQNAQTTMDQIQSTGTVEMDIVVVVAGSIVLFIMLYTVRERTKEIGTLKALGASNTAILGQFMLEGILLSLIAGLVGVAIGAFGATSLANLLLPHPTQVINSSASSTGISIPASASASISVTITPELVLFGLGAAVLLGALGSLYPAWRAARTRPAEAMRYD